MVIFSYFCIPNYSLLFLVVFAKFIFGSFGCFILWIIDIDHVFEPILSKTCFIFTLDYTYIYMEIVSSSFSLIIFNDNKVRLK